MPSQSSASHHSLDPPLSAGVNGGVGVGQPLATAHYPSPFQKGIDDLGKFTPILANRTVLS